MLERVMDRLEGIDPSRLHPILVELLIAAEALGQECDEFLNRNGTREALLAQHQSWQTRINDFYERFVK